MVSRNKSKAAGQKFGYGSLLMAALLLTPFIPAVPQGTSKPATIEATAMGTSTQLGQRVDVKMIINRFSTDEDLQVLIAAFKKGQNEGLVTALRKMPSVGRIAITGSVGDDLAYVRLTRTPTGRIIRFATNRPIRFGEAYFDNGSKSYNLTAGEFYLDDANKNKSTGVVYPACQLIVNHKGELQFDLIRNPWKLVQIIDWNKAGMEAQ